MENWEEQNLNLVIRERVKEAISDTPSKIYMMKHLESK